jgi:predicted TIM-barrel fold metal-dependent hydrolase
MLPKSEAIIQETIHCHAEGPMALSKASPGTIMNSMDQAGIARSVLIAFPWADSALCRENNDFILEQVAVNDRFMAVCSVQPASLDALAEARRVLHAGAIGIKINPVWQGFCLDDAHVNDLAAVVLQNNVFLMLHVDQPYKQSPASPAYLFDLAVRLPELKILASHLGGLLGLSSLHKPIAQKTVNIWYDTAVSSTLEMVTWYFEAGLEDKIVFGSDFPFNHSHSQKQVVEGILKLGLANHIESKIFESNFMALSGTEI